MSMIGCLGSTFIRAFTEKDGKNRCPEHVVNSLKFRIFIYSLYSLYVIVCSSMPTSSSY